MNEASFTLLREAKVDGRGIWLYQISTPIGDIYAVQFEYETKEIETSLSFNVKEKAEKAFVSYVEHIVQGRL